eukprot:scaffold31455_cov112-Isochrysis_galbana.AAC.2
MCVFPPKGIAEMVARARLVAHRVQLDPHRVQLDPRELSRAVRAYDSVVPPPCPAAIPPSLPVGRPAAPALAARPNRSERDANASVPVARGRMDPRVQT